MVDEKDNNDGFENEGMTAVTRDGQRYPVLPLRDIVVFPHMIVPLFVGREKSVRALEEVMSDDKQIMLISQRDAGLENPTPDDLYKTGTLGTVLQLLKLPDGAIKVLVEGGSRAEIVHLEENDDYLEADVIFPDEDFGENDSETEALPPCTSPPRTSAVS